MSRELGRNTDPRTGNYLPEQADRLAWERQRRPRASKLAGNPGLRAAVRRSWTAGTHPGRPAGG